MADDDTTEDGNEPADEPTTPTSFSQEDLDRIMGETRQQARSAATKELADTLGTTIDEAKAIIARHQEAEKAAMTDAERAAADAREREAAARTAEAEATRKLVSADVTLALVEAGLTSPTVRAEAAVLVMAKLDLDNDVTSAEVAAAVQAVRDAVPALFADTPKPPSGDTTRGRPPQGPSSTQTAAERGRARARAMQGIRDDS